MQAFLIRFAQAWGKFREDELRTASQIEGIELEYDAHEYREDNPYLVVHMKSWEDARKLAKRCLLIKRIYEIWGSGESYEEVLAQAGKVCDEKIIAHNLRNKTWRYRFETFGHVIPIRHHITRFEKFYPIINMEGAVDFNNPQVNLTIMEDYLARDGYRSEPYRIFMGPTVASSRRKELLVKYDLSTRLYLGTTTMDAELSFLMATQALAAPGKLVMDPFCGTGGVLYGCSHYGAYTIGTDIDGRQMRGTTKAANRGKDGIRSNVEHYGLSSLILDLAVCDLAHSPWRSVPDGFLDAIVTDPPYGVRAGARTIGSQPGLREPRVVVAEERGALYPRTVPYELDEVICGLLEFASKTLKPKGRLVYWLPVSNPDPTIEYAPSHPAFNLISMAEQSFGKWSRFLVTMERKPNGEEDRSLGSAPVAKASFRKLYFNIE